MKENTIYSDQLVTITNARVVILGTTYPTRNITSVKMTLTSPKRGCALLLLLYGLISFVAAFFPQEAYPWWTVYLGIVVASLIIAGAIFWLRRSKPKYNLVLSTASGESHALTSPQQEYVGKIVKSINDAIAQQ